MSTTHSATIMMNDPFAGLSGFGTSPTQPEQQSNPFALQQQQSQEQASVSSGNPYGNYQQQQQQQAPMPVANDNPFAAYGNQQQQSMVQSTQQSNQWSMQQQQQQQPSSYNMQMGYQTQSPQTFQQGGYPQQSTMNTMTPQQQQPNQLERVTSSAQSVASSQYMTPSTYGASPQSHNTPMMMTPAIPTQSQQQLFLSPQPGPAPSTQQQQDYPNANGFMQQQPPQQPPQPPPAPPAPVITETNDEDDDFFGDFSTSVQKKEAQSPHKSTRPPSEFETDNYESVSVLSKSTNNTERNSQGASPLDDPRFAPKPPKPHGYENALALARNAPPGSSPLPDYEMVTHSGYALARISFRTILIKKWKQVFWVTYGANKLLVFRSSADFEDWVSNPYLNASQRDFLVKLEVDFVGDLINEKNIRGYQVTNQRMKNYSNQMLYQFKLERWMDYGPTIAAAFASPNERELFHLRTIIGEILKRSSQNRRNNPYHQHAYGNQGYSNQGYPPAGDRNNFHTAVDPPAAQRFNYSSSASTGMLHEQGSLGGGRSVRSGIFSTGPVEQRRGDGSHYHQAVGGYRPTTSRSNYHY